MRCAGVAAQASAAKIGKSAFSEIQSHAGHVSCIDEKTKLDVTPAFQAHEGRRGYFFGKYIIYRVENIPMGLQQEKG
jgi:hypothetical protein